MTVGKQASKIFKKGVGWWVGKKKKESRVKPNRAQNWARGEGVGGHGRVKEHAKGHIKWKPVLLVGGGRNNARKEPRPLESAH